MEVKTLNPFFLLPDFLSLHPCAEHVPAAIKNDQVSVRARSKRSFPILDAKAPRRIESHAFYRFTQGTSREPREVPDAGVEGDNARANLSVVKLSCVGDGRDAPASEGVGALEIQLGPFLHETLAVAPLMYSVF